MDEKFSFRFRYHNQMVDHINLQFSIHTRKQNAFLHVSYFIDALPLIRNDKIVIFVKFFSFFFCILSKRYEKSSVGWKNETKTRNSHSNRHIIFDYTKEFLIKWNYQPLELFEVKENVFTSHILTILKQRTGSVSHNVI